jgi:hypothetical protein
MTRQNFQIFLLGLGAEITQARLIEASLVGRGVISTYLAPVAFVAPILATFLRTPKK